jgi:hypothetical protein
MGSEITVAVTFLLHLFIIDIIIFVVVVANNAHLPRHV